MQFPRDTLGMEDAKKYLLKKMFGTVPDALEFKTLSETLVLFEKAAKNTGRDLGMVVSSHSGEKLKAAHHFLLNMIDSLGGVNRNAIHENYGAVRIYGSTFGDIDSTTLDTLADYYTGKLTVADIETAAAPVTDKQPTYLDDALAVKRSAVNTLQRGVEVVMGDDYDVSKLAFNDDERLKRLLDSTLKAVEITRMCPPQSVPRKLESFRTRIREPQHPGKSNSIDAIRLGVMVGLSIKAEQEGKTIEEIIDQSVAEGKIVIEPKKEKKNSGGSPGLWTNRTEPQDFGR
jgi:hypothetical protein